MVITLRRSSRLPPAGPSLPVAATAIAISVLAPHPAARTMVVDAAIIALGCSPPVGIAAVTCRCWAAAPGSIDSPLPTPSSASSSMPSTFSPFTAAAGELALILPLLAARHDDAVVVLGVLQIVLGQHRVAGGGSIARERQVLLGNVRGCAADLHVGAGRFEAARQRILALAVVLL
jgi:hypothetical protein